MSQTNPEAYGDPFGKRAAKGLPRKVRVGGDLTSIGADSEKKAFFAR